VPDEVDRFADGLDRGHEPVGVGLLRRGEPLGSGVAEGREIGSDDVVACQI
jgi:hypothetical protein